MTKFTRDARGNPICAWCDHFVSIIVFISIFAAIVLAIAAIWGFDLRWFYTSAVIAGAALILSAGKT